MINPCYSAKDFEVWDKPTFKFDEIGSLRPKPIMPASKQPEAEAIAIKARNKIVRLKDMVPFLHIFLHSTSYNLAKYEQGDPARLAMARKAAGHAIKIIDQIKEMG
ncbi:MAG: hypothetical protein PHT07_24370 [Paludibacter sp.]|nr:hypothetical protein [Paludibacter sp.]